MDGSPKKTRALYRRLLSKYGPQGWWPADSRFEVVVGALLTQNTNWGNVGKAIRNLKEAHALDPKKIISMRLCTLENLIRPSGFYRQKALRLRNLCGKFIELESRGFPPSRDELLEMNGIGKETADSILLYAYDLPHFVIDSYTRRFCTHHGLFESKKYDEYKDFFERVLPRDAGLYKEYHALIVEWGKRMKNKNSSPSLRARANPSGNR